MNETYFDTLMEIAESWSAEQLTRYIEKLEDRQETVKTLLKHMRMLRRKKIRKPALDTGTRGGK